MRRVAPAPAGRCSRRGPGKVQEVRSVARAPAAASAEHGLVSPEYTSRQPAWRRAGACVRGRRAAAHGEGRRHGRRGALPWRCGGRWGEMARDGERWGEMGRDGERWEICMGGCGRLAVEDDTPRVGAVQHSHGAEGGEPEPRLAEQPVPLRAARVVHSLVVGKGDAEPAGRRQQGLGPLEPSQWGEMGRDGESWGELGRKWGELGRSGERWGETGLVPLQPPADGVRPDHEQRRRGVPRAKRQSWRRACALNGGEQRRQA